MPKTDNKTNPLNAYITKLLPKYGSCNALYKFYLTDNSRPIPTKGATQFKQFYKKALAEYTAAQKLIEDKANDQTIEEQIKAKKKALDDRMERLAELQKQFIDLKNVKVGNGKLIERINVILGLCKLDERISKAEGTDAPTKSAQTDTEGNDKESPLDKLIKAGGKIVING